MLSAAAAIILGEISNSETATMKCPKMRNNVLDIKGGGQKGF